MIEAWKLLRVRKDGSLGSLFINKRAVLSPGKWMKSEEHPTKGFKERKGWHAVAKKKAPHLSKKNRVWKRVELRGKIEFIERPKSQGEVWIIADQMRIK